ncbi:MAG: aminoacyl-tRNA hydrolase, partial [Myxococcota bacterium]
MKLICGLGNPGREYERHRHNVGFMVVDLLVQRAKAALNQEKFDGRVGQGDLAGERVIFLEPQTFMNLAGRSLAAAARFYKVPPSEVLVVHDELDLPFGRLQLKSGGGPGGHNGIKSILQCWGTDAFARLRVGIGKPEGPDAKERVIGHVLGGFTKTEQEVLPALLGRAADGAELWVRGGLAAAMNRVNRRQT